MKQKSYLRKVPQLASKALTANRLTRDQTKAEERLIRRMEGRSS